MLLPSQGQIQVGPQDLECFYSLFSEPSVIKNSCDFTKICFWNKNLHCLPPFSKLGEYFTSLLGGSQVDKHYAYIMVLLACGYFILIAPLVFVLPLFGTSVWMLALLVRDMEKPPHD